MSRTAASLAVTALVAAALLGACAARPPARPAGTGPAPATSTPIASGLATAPPAAKLGTVEVRDFRGRPLDAVASEPENSIKGPQPVDIATYRLTVSGSVRTPLSLTYAQVLAMPAYEKATTLVCIDGWQRTYLWQGVLLEDLLARAGARAGASVVIFRCADGYTESLPLDYVRQHHLLLAYGMNGTVMPPERGFPFQVVAEDKLGYKWAKWVTAIELSNNARFRGYWEQRGADNTATLPLSGE